jgi:mono/diheme cytochrome c family protein
VKSIGWLNGLLCVGFASTTALCLALKGRDVSQPNYDFLPEAQMARSDAYDSFTPNHNFPDGLTLRVPPRGTIPRGHLPLHYGATLDDAARAGQELKSPFSEDDAAHLARGSFVFTHYCQVCHGPLGQGNGPITQAGFPPPASLLAERAVQMRDGQMFHVLTYGQQNMPAFAVQLSPEDRWSVILHVRSLQEPSTPSGVSGRSREVARLFHENCAACHGEDGSGKGLRKVWPLIPDFTSLAWQMSQTEMAIVNQINYGSRPLMPAFRYKLHSDQILRLAVYVRSFAAHAPGTPVPASSHLTAGNVYGTFCFACHDTNGKGDPKIRPAMPELPDFTSAAWQKTRTDSELAQSILLGKGKFMLANSDKLGSVDVKQMVTLVRGFEGGKQVVPIEEPKLAGPVVTDIPETPAPGGGTIGPKIEEPKIPAEPEPDTSEDLARRIRVGANIFRQYCIVCHGPDGTGTVIRSALPKIPDFTSPAFHKDHSDAQLMVSILDGKGTQMPANRGRVSENQVGDLVAYVRAFGPKIPGTKPRVSDTEFEKSFRQLQEQWNELQKELQKTKGKQ